MQFQCPRCNAIAQGTPGQSVVCPRCGFSAPAPGTHGAPAPHAPPPGPPGAPASYPGVAMGPPGQHAQMQPGMPMPQATSGLAITALITGILGLVGFMVFGFVLGIVAIITGALGIRECNQQMRQGRGMAIAGLVMGVLSMLWLPLMLMLVFF